jgi:arylsulfatase
LDELALADDTLVIFTADHGEMLGEHGLLLKGSYPSRALPRVPLLRRCPGGIGPATVCTTPTGNADVVPTVLTPLGHDIPPAVQGQALAPVLAGEPGRGNAVSMGWARTRGDVGHQTLFTGHWGISWFPQFHTGELDEDPGEPRNLYDGPSHRDTRERLLADLFRGYVGYEQIEQTAISAQ